MTAPVIHQSQALTESTKIFPKLITKNYTSSATFMKQVTVIAVSSITYLKDVFPEDSYCTEQFFGMKLKILKKKGRDEVANFLSSALTKSFEAFDKKYLDQLALCFYEGECKADNLVEYHLFEYSYNTEGASVSVSYKSRDSTEKTTKFTFDKVREETKQLFQNYFTIFKQRQIKPLDNFEVSLRLYYNDDAPEGYQAPGYIASVEDEDHLELTAAKTHELGCVKTPFHQLAASFYVKEGMAASYEAIPSQNPPKISELEPDFNVSVEKCVSESREVTLRCPCNKRSDYEGGVGSLLICQYCNTYQHAECFGLIAENAARITQHCCTHCYEEDQSRIPTDHALVLLNPYQRKSLCILRRALCLCAREGSMCTPDLSAALDMSNAHAAKLMRLLHTYGIVRQGTDDELTKAQKISIDNLKTAMKRFFQTSQDENLADRLFAEYFASQESQQDPVGEVLGPLEKVSLQNASNLGRIIETCGDQRKSEIDDPTLKQYRDALLSNKQLDEDLPPGHIKIITNLVKKKTTKRKINKEIVEDMPSLRPGVRNKRSKTKEEIKSRPRLS